MGGPPFMLDFIYGLLLYFIPNIHLAMDIFLTGPTATK
jgi:hypothetical protein